MKCKHLTPTPQLYASWHDSWQIVFSSREHPKPWLCCFSCGTTKVIFNIHIRKYTQKEPPSPKASPSSWQIVFSSREHPKPWLCCFSCGTTKVIFNIHIRKYTQKEPPSPKASPSRDNFTRAGMTVGRLSSLAGNTQNPGYVVLAAGPPKSYLISTSGNILRRNSHHLKPHHPVGRLSSLALIHIHYQHAIDLDTVVLLFAELHPRKLQLSSVLLETQ